MRRMAAATPVFGFASSMSATTSGASDGPSLAPDVVADMDEAKPKTSVAAAILRIFPAPVVFFMVMGLIMFGVPTPTEAL